MKYDEEIFKLSIEANEKINSTNDNANKEIKQKQNKLLKMLLKKFEEQLKSKENTNDGILKVKFEKIFYSSFNDGYNEINELVKSNNFNSFASDYCMYISDIDYRCNEWYSAYYEIIWDYQTYFKQLRESKEGKETLKTIKYAKTNAKRELCKKNGHNWGPWKEIVGNKTMNDGPHDLSERCPYEDVTCKIQIPKWQRKCTVCGCTSTVETKPLEVEQTETKEEIKRLQKKLESMNIKKK